MLNIPQEGRYRLSLLQYAERVGLSIICYKRLKKINTVRLPQPVLSYS